MITASIRRRFSWPNIIFTHRFRKFGCRTPGDGRKGGIPSHQQRRTIGTHDRRGVMNQMWNGMGGRQVLLSGTEVKQALAYMEPTFRKELESG
jgi:hypothetical protein